jgi:hypothetical protein
MPPGGYVQKVHKISDDIVIAFADCIRLAFAIIDGIRSEFMPKFDDRLLAEPEVVAQRLTRFIAYKYKQRRRPGERVELMVFIRPKNELSVSFGLWKLVSPHFNRQAPAQPFEMLEIGSGSLASEYRDLIRRGSKGFVEVPGENGEKPTAIVPVGKMGMQWLFAEALDHQVAGVSHAMHLMLLYPDGVILKERPQEPEAEFPSVATTWAELHADLQRRGIRVAACRALA